MTIQTGAATETEILTRKSGLDIFHGRVIEKAQLMRDTLDQLQKLKPGEGKKNGNQIEDIMDQFYLQINDFERL